MASGPAPNVWTTPNLPPAEFQPRCTHVHHRQFHPSRLGELNTLNPIGPAPITSDKSSAIISARSTAWAPMPSVFTSANSS